MTAKDMLAVVLRRAELTERERESFTDMWDRLHRFNRCSDKQRAWIEKVYFGQKLDREAPMPVTTVRRRVVIPTWLKAEPGAKTLEANQTALAGNPPVPETTPISPERGFIKTNARQVLMRRKSGTFMLPSPDPMVGTTSGEARPIGYINYPGIQREELVTSLVAFESICPRITRGSKQYQKVAGFFERGGVVLKVKPLSEARVA